MRIIGLFFIVAVEFSFAQKAVDTFSITTLDSLVRSVGPDKTPSFDTLAGPLPDTVKSSKKGFIVVGDIEVPVNKSVTIAAGTVFLFKNFTGLHVQGKLIAHGTKDRPIIFTSENDRAFNASSALYPNPFDWNGIYIHPDAVGATLSFCKILFSVYGIISETKFVRLDEITFKQNGKSNLTIEGKEAALTDQTYSNVPKTEEPRAIPVAAPPRLKDPLIAQREMLRYGGVSLASVSTALTAYLLTRPAASRPYAAATGFVAVIGCLGFTWSFFF